MGGGKFHNRERKINMLLFFIMFQISENNIAKISIISTIVLVFFLTSSLGYILISNYISHVDKDLSTFKVEHVGEHKTRIKTRVANLIKAIDLRRKDLTSANMQEGVRLLLNTLRKISEVEEAGEYIFVYQLQNNKEGDKFAKMLININRPELEGKLISSNTVDAKGFHYRREMLSKIKKKGEGFVKYWYKKPINGETVPKMSYFKLYKPWNWIVAQGFYLDDLKDEAFKLQQRADKQVRKDIIWVFSIFIIFVLLATIISAYISIRIGRIIERHRKASAEKNSKLEISEKRFHDMASSLSDMLWELDLETRHTYISGRVKEVLGYSTEEMIGKRVADIISPEDMPLVEERLRAFHEKGSPLGELIVRAYTKDERDLKYLQCSAIPVENEKGELIGYRGVSKDITLKVITEQYKNSLLNKLEEKNHDLEDKNKRMNKFVGMVSHDLRNPLWRISELSDMLQDKVEIAPLDQYARIIHENSVQSLKLVSEILEIAALKDGKFTVTIQRDS